MRWIAPRCAATKLTIMSTAGTESGAIEVRVNGEPRKVSSGSTIESFLNDCDIDPGLVVVERNGVIVDRGAYASTPLDSDDSLEVVHFVGGG